MKVKELRRAIRNLDDEKEVRVIFNVSDRGVANTSGVGNLYIEDAALLIKPDNIDPWYPTTVCDIYNWKK